MKTSIGWIGLALALVCFAHTSTAQVMGPYGASPYDSGGFQPMVGDVQIGMPGRFWIGSNIADRGLGYRGTYLTLGAKTPIGEDFFDGRWLMEGRGHFSTESQRFFGNFGLERVISIHAAGADVSMGVWGDYDDDRQGDFAHTFSQVGVTGQIKTRSWDLIGNGYFPVGTANYTIGDPTGANVFFENRIVVRPAIDSALKGFDATLRVRPSALARVNGRIDIGGYGYQSDLIDFFGGGRVRLGMQVLRGLIVSAEVNHDDRFDTTGVLQVGWIFGANARGNEYSGLGRDLEPTVRNDHIVRFQQDVIWAIDPDTGLPYTVWHVDNSADAGVAIGTFERRFVTLADAEAASSPEDIIFVHPGFGNTLGMSDGIVLKDGQLFLGSGVEHLIPIPGRLFRLSNPVDGNRPVITNTGLGAAVTLANRNTVRGFEIDGSAGGMVHGIFGDGFAAGSPINHGTIEDNIIHDAILHGVFVTTLSGNWEVNRNTIFDNGFDGILLAGAVDPTSEFNFQLNDVSSNGRHGIHMSSYDASRITFRDNTTDGNLGDGVHLETFTNGAGTGLFLDFFDHVATGNVGSGVNIIDGDGNLRFVNGQIVGNGAAGLRIRDWRNTDATHRTVIATTGGGTSNFLDNGIGTGAGVDNRLSFGVQRLIITDTTFDGNGTGIRSISDGLTANLTTSIVDNRAINNSLSFGVDVGAFNGSIHAFTLEQTAGAFPAALPMIGNGAIAGDAVRMLVGDGSGTIASMVASIRNVNIVGTGGAGVAANVTLDGNLILDMQNMNIVGNAGTGALFDFNTNLNLAINTVNMNNINFVNNGGSSVVLATGPETFADLIMTNLVMTHTGGAGGLNGLSILATGDGLAGVDNRTRVLLANSTISNHNLNGISAVTAGDANLFLEIFGNVITGNGPAFDPDALPYFHGISITAGGSSTLSTRIFNNQVTGNFERGIRMETTGTATMNALLVGNNFGLNDVGEDIGNDPIIDSNIEDALFINGPGATFCLAMSNNVFAFDATFVNLGAAIDFFIELDGLSNGFGEADLGPGFTFGPFGAVCPLLIDADEAGFLADGFPPR